jgi:uncharacterized protein (DUF433 family)
LWFYKFLILKHQILRRTHVIQSDPLIMMGKPVIAGTRITVELILEKLAAGETIEQILEAHPRLTRETIQAALAFAASALHADVVYPVR